MIIKVFPKYKNFVTYNLGKACNFTCSYCIQDKIRNNPPKIPDEIVRKRSEEACNFLQKRFKNDNFPVRITLIGGEPTLHNLPYCVEPFLKLKNLNEFAVTTNFSAPNSKFIEMYDFCRSNHINFSFTVSIHEEFWKFENFTKKFIEIYNYIQIPRVQIVVTDKNQETIKPYIKFITDNYPKSKLAVNFDKRIKTKNNSKTYQMATVSRENKEPSVQFNDTLFYSKEKAMIALKDVDIEGATCKLLPEGHYICMTISDKKNHELMYKIRNCRSPKKLSEELDECVKCERHFCSLCTPGIIIEK